MIYPKFKDHLYKSLYTKHEELSFQVLVKVVQETYKTHKLFLLPLIFHERKFLTALSTHNYHSVNIILIFPPNINISLIIMCMLT